MAKTLGEADTDDYIKRALEQTTAKYQDQWNQNLALAYSQHLSDEAIQSLHYNGKHSPFFEELSQQQTAIGKTMQESSRELLKQVISETLDTAYQAAVDSAE